MTAKKPLVIVTRKLPDIIETRMMELFNVRLNLDDHAFTPAEMADAVKEADVLVPTVTDRLDSRILAQAGPQLKLIANYGAGIDHVDLASARQRGITVTNTPGVLTEDTADMTMALLLAVPRRLIEGERLLQSGEWSGWSPTGLRGSRIWGKRLGIIGMGRIGQAVARRAQAFGMQIHYHNCGRGTGSHLLGEPGPDAGANGHHFRQLPAYTGDIPFVVGPAVETDATPCLCDQHVAR